MSVVCCPPAQNIFNQKAWDLNMRCSGNTVPTLDGGEEMLFEMLIRDGFYSKPPPTRPQVRNFKKPEPKPSVRYLSSNGYSGGQVMIPEVPAPKPEVSWPNMLRKKKEVKRPQALPPTWPLKERPLSIDPCKDYSKPLSVDCSVEYDLPKNIKPPEGAEPILKIASPPRPKTTLPPATWILQPVNNHYIVQSEDQIFIVPAEPIQPMLVVPEEQFVDTIILSSGVQTPVVSNDSGRGTDGCRSPMEFLTPEGSRWIYQTDVPNSPEPVTTVPDLLLDSAALDRQEVAGTVPFLPSYTTFANRQTVLVPQKPPQVHHRKSYSVDGPQRKGRPTHARQSSPIDFFELERRIGSHINPVLLTFGHNPIIYV